MPIDTRRSQKLQNTMKNTIFFSLWLSNFLTLESVHFFIVVILLLLSSSFQPSVGRFSIFVSSIISYQTLYGTQTHTSIEYECTYMPCNTTHKHSRRRGAKWTSAGHLLWNSFSVHYFFFSVFFLSLSV